MKVLFVAWGSIDGLSHWRSLLPANAMGADIVCFDMNCKVVYEEAKYQPYEYDVAIVQSCWYDWQYKIIEKFRANGTKIILNVDDWIKGIGRRTKNLSEKSMWSTFAQADVQRMHERILRNADGILSSTIPLADKLSKYGRVGLAPNGLDLKRYSPWRDPIRDDGVIVGWAGGIGHSDVIREIAPAVNSAIDQLNADGIDTKLCIVGQDERSNFNRKDAMYLKWADKYIYPKYLSCFDISLAPSRDDSFYKYKSQLRLYEAIALGTPTIGGELYESEIDGFGTVCKTSDDWYNSIIEYASSESLRDSIRENCYSRVDEFTIDSRISLWQSEIQSLLDGSSTSAEQQLSLKNMPKTDKTSISQQHPVR